VEIRTIFVGKIFENCFQGLGQFFVKVGGSFLLT